MSILNAKIDNDNIVEKERMALLFDASLNHILINVGIMIGICVGMIGLNVSIEPVFLLLTIVTTFYIVFYSIVSGIYITIFLKCRNSRLTDGFNSFRDGCTELAFKNYRLLNEYHNVYDYHYRDTMQKCADRIKSGEIKGINYTNNTKQIDITEYVKFVLQNDATEKMDEPKQIESKIEQIYQYIYLAYYLTFLKPSDSLTLNSVGSDHIIHVNIGSDSVFNKRNRRIEDYLNRIDLQKKRELIRVWKANGTISVVPLRWAYVLYRNIFRYIHCAKYLKDIYNSFDRDYAEFENSVGKIVKSLNILTSDKEIVPKHFQTLHFIMNDALIIFIDALVASTIIKSYVLYKALLVPLIIGVCAICSLVIIVRSLRYLLNEQSDTKLNSEDIETIDDNIEAVFNDMRVLTA
jgi:hypothetical protein